LAPPIDFPLHRPYRQKYGGDSFWHEDELEALLAVLKLLVSDQILMLLLTEYLQQVVKLHPPLLLKVFSIVQQRARDVEMYYRYLRRLAILFHRRLSYLQIFCRELGNLMHRKGV